MACLSGSEGLFQIVQHLGSRIQINSGINIWLSQGVSDVWDCLAGINLGLCSIKQDLHGALANTVAIVSDLYWG